MNILIDFGDDQSVRNVHIKELSPSEDGKEYACRFKPTSDYTMFYNEQQLAVAMAKAEEKLAEVDDSRPWSQELSQVVGVTGEVDSLETED